MSTTTDFPAGILDHIISSLSLTIRLHLLSSAAELFRLGLPPPGMDQLIRTITNVDMKGLHSMKAEQFINIFQHLPFQTLTHLNLSHYATSSTFNTITQFMSTAPVFETLVELNFSSSLLQTVEHLLSGPNTFPALTTLDLSCCEDIDITALSTTSKLANLKHLNLAYCNVEAPAAQMLAAAQFTLESLDLGHCGQLEDEGVIALIKSPMCSNLRKLTLTNTTIGDSTIAAITANEPPLFPQLELLDISINWDISPNVLQTLAQTPSLHNLLTLNISATALTRETLDRIISSPFLSNVIHLDVSNNPDLDITPIITHLTNPATNPARPKLKSLNISSLPMELNNIQLISNSEAFSQLKVLDLGYILLTREPVPVPQPDQQNYIGGMDLFAQLAQFVDNGGDVADFMVGENDDDNGVVGDNGGQVDQLVDQQVDGDNGNDNGDDDNHHLMNEAFHILAQSTTLSNLKSLLLPVINNSASETAINALLSSQTLSDGLIELNLMGHRTTNDNITTLTTQPATLSHQSISHTSTTPPLKFANLERLTLDESKITAEAIGMLGELTNINYLRLDNIPTLDNDTTITALLTPLSTSILPQLQTLNIAHGNLTHVGCERLAQSALLGQLDELILNFNPNITELGVTALMSSPAISNLGNIHLYGCGWDFDRRALRGQGFFKLVVNCTGWCEAFD